MQYFIAIIAPPHINQKVLEWKKYMHEQFGCKAALKSPAHITLIPPFHMPEDKEAELTGHLQQFSAGKKAFDIYLRNLSSFKPRVIFVAIEPNDPLAELKQRLEDYLTPLSGFSFRKEGRPFHPHITIANRDLDKKDYPHAWQHFRAVRFEEVFEADNISLLRHNKVNWEIAHTVSLFSRQAP